jgi:uncharacterized membrane protein YedE/YeeE
MIMGEVEMRKVLCLLVDILSGAVAFTGIFVDLFIAGRYDTPMRTPDGHLTSFMQISFVLLALSFPALLWLGIKYAERLWPFFNDTNSQLRLLVASYVFGLLLMYAAKHLWR